MLRIFETHMAYELALALPVDHPGAWRHLDSFGRAFFVCSVCGAVKSVRGTGCGTGYGLTGGTWDKARRQWVQGSAQMVCLDCCAMGDAYRLREYRGPFFAYLSSDGKTVSNWPGAALMTVISGTLTESRAGWNGGNIARFHARDVWGQWWQGRGMGRGMCCTLRPMKAPHYSRTWAKWGAGTIRGQFARNERA